MYVFTSQLLSIKVLSLKQLQMSCIEITNNDTRTYKVYKTDFSYKIESNCPWGENRIYLRSRSKENLFMNALL